MKSYTITVNGVAYDVTVEETAGNGAPVAAPKAAPKTAPKAAPAVEQAAASAAGAVEVKASVPGKVCKIEASVGQALKAGDTIMILEAMKMEIPVVAPQDGSVASINVAVGDSVDNGAVLASMN